MIVLSKNSNPVKSLYDFMFHLSFVVLTSSFPIMLTQLNCSIGTSYALRLCDFNDNFMLTSSGHRLNSPRVYMTYIQLYTASISKAHWTMKAEIFNRPRLSFQDPDQNFKTGSRDQDSRTPRLNICKCNGFTFKLQHERPHYNDHHAVAQPFKHRCPEVNWTVNTADVLATLISARTVMGVSNRP